MVYLSMVLVTLFFTLFYKIDKWKVCHCVTQKNFCWQATSSSFYYSTFSIHTCLNIKILSAGTFKLSRYVGYMNDYVEVMFRITAFCVGIVFDFCAKYCFSTKLYIFEIRRKTQIKEHWHSFDLILKYISANSSVSFKF